MQKAAGLDLLNAAPQEASGSTRLKTLIHTNKPDEAQQFLGGLYGEHGLRLQQAKNMDLEMRGFNFEDLHVGVIRYGSPAVASLDDRRPLWVFSYLHKGSITRGDGSPVAQAGDTGVNAPDDMRDVVMSADMELVNLRILEGDMNQACRAMLGSDLSHPLRFVTDAPAGTAPAVTLTRLIDRIAALPLYQHAAARQLERNLKSAALLELLLAWPNSYTQHLDDQTALPASTQKARDYIHAHAADLPSLEDIARACHVGVRALSRGFEKHMNTSPMRYMLDYRLDQVRADMLQRRDAASVTEVAFKWGFLHLSMFAARYRERFGELPSETLKRARH
jgi:AraC-like DNA-binding protein